MTAVGRFAPSPSGDLHLGTLTTALGSWLHVRHQGGRWLIRIDDIDPGRERPGAARRLLDGLRRCGLEPDAPPLFQSSRTAAYQDALDRLAQQDLVFPCWCSRRDLQQAGHLHRDGHCVHPPDPERPPALRLRVPAGTIRFDDLFCGPCQQDIRAEVGDFVLRRADGCWSYHLASAVDEAYMGITEVIRGRDLLDSAPRQILLLRLLGLPDPAWGHLPLVLGTDGNKLSKSDRRPGLSLDDPVAAIRLALHHLGQRPLPATSTDVASALDAAVQHFDPRAIPVTCTTTGA